MDHTIKIRKSIKHNSKELLEKLTKEELIEKIQSLEAHNIQLQNIINKSESSSTNDASKMFDFSKCKFRHILLHIFYFGWDYRGFVTQEDTINTIEYHLFKALSRTCLIKDRSSSNYNRCGRTDKGVSSFGQVISIDVRSKLDGADEADLSKEINYCKILNRVLPDNIQCVAWAPVDNGFSSRFNCLCRTYKYYFPRGNLDIEKMREGVRYLVGSHDFRNFGKMDVGNGVVQFTRNILDFEIVPWNVEDKNNEYSVYVAIIKGNAFIWHQIRCILGILFLIGTNKEEPELIKELLNINENPRKPEYDMANEIPLNLFHCEYDNVQWFVSQESLKDVIRKVQKIWTITAIKQTMLKDCLNNLIDKLDDKEVTKCLSDNLIGGIKPKKYVPIMKRQKCDSLETKIEHYTKRKRIDVILIGTEEN